MGFLEGLLCVASHVPAELKGLFYSICLKAAGLYDSCRGSAIQVVLTLSAQTRCWYVSKGLSILEIFPSSNNK